MRARMQGCNNRGYFVIMLLVALSLLLTCSSALWAQPQLPGYRAPLVDSYGTPTQWYNMMGGDYNDNDANHPAEITELARGLRYNPGDIYKLIYDYVAFEPSWGDVKGAYMTWMDRSGNAFDQAALAVALLELAATNNSDLTIADPCFVVGEIQLTQDQAWDWLKMPSDANESAQVLARNGLYGTLTTDASGDVTAVNLEHVWVRVTIDNELYEFDPSFKTYTSKGGLYNYQLEIAMDFNETDFLDDAEEGATINAYDIQDINTVNIAANLTDYSTTLANYILAYNDANEGAFGSLGDIIGSRRIVPVDANDLPPSTLPYTVVSRDEMFASDEIPDIYRTTLRVQHQGVDETFYSSDIYGRRLALSINDSNQAQLLLDGTVKETGNTLAPGQSYELTLTVDHPYEVNDFDASVSMNLKAGGYYVINNGWGDTGTKILAKLRQDLKQLRFDGVSDSNEAVLGTSYSLVGMTWLAQTSKLRNLARWTGDAAFAHTITNHHLVGITGEYDSPLLDMPICALGMVSHDNDHEDEPEGMFLALTGHANAYQHAVIRQLQDVNSVSAVKLLDMANALTSNGKLFTATSSTWSNVQSQLDDYSTAEVNQVDVYVDAGYSVILPQEGNLSLDNWTGTGFYAKKFDANELTVSYVAGDGSCSGYSAATSTALDASDLSERCYDPPLGLNGIGQGAYGHSHTDLSTGASSMPYGLTFSRAYSSNRHLDDGPVGLGWNHNFNISAKVTSDSFQMLGEDSAVDTATQIVTLYVAQDIKRPISTYAIAMIESWLVDRMQDNLVVLDNGGTRTRFLKQPDGHYQAPRAAKLKMIEQANGNLRVKNASGKFYDFNSDGTISQWSDQFGNVVDFSYSSSKLSSVVCKIGGTSASWDMEFTYDANDRLTEVEDSANRSIELTYDADGQLTTYTNADANSTTYDYDPNCVGRFTELLRPVDDPNDPTVTVQYDSLGRIKQVIDANDICWDHYFADFRKELLEPAQPDPNDPNLTEKRFSTVVWTNEVGQRVLSFDQLGREGSIEYNDMYQAINTVSPFKNSSTYSLVKDANDPNVFYIEQTGNLCRPFSPHTDPNTYWGYGNDSFENDDGRWFIIRETSTDPNGYTTSHTYDPNYGTLTKTTYPEVGGGDANEPEVFLTYTSYGQVETKTDPKGMVTKYEYYGAAAGGQLKKTIVDYGTGKLNITTELTYNSAGQVLTAKDPNGYTTQNQYTTGGRLKKTIAPSPFSYETTFEYYADGKPKCTKRELSDNTVIILEELTYNKLGQVVSRRGPYDEDTNDVNEINTNYTQYEYDDLGRTVKVIDAEGNETETKYYPDGKVWKTIDAKGNAVVTYTYDPNDGTLTKVEDAKGNATEYEYNGFGALKKTTFADGTYIEPTYDGVRRVVKSRNRAGEEITFEYDGLHRVKKKVVPGDSSTIIKHTYDLCGRVTKVNYGTSTSNVDITSTYDSAGRLTQITDGVGRTTSFEYDLNSNRTKLTYPDSSYITYEYDQLNRPTKIKDDSNTTLAEYTYDERSRRTKVDYANGTSTSYSYDEANRLLSIDNDANDVDFNYDYTYDDVGNRLTMKFNNSDPNTHTYTYDKIYQITDVNYPAAYAYLVGDTSFSYDSVGNRSSVIESETVSYTTNIMNQYTTVAGVYFDYDTKGNLTYDAANIYEYDAENRLIEIRKSEYNGTGPLTVATDCDLVFTTGGDANWVDVNDVYYHNLDSARSGSIDVNETTWMETTVQGEGSITFVVKSDISSGSFVFSVDGSVETTSAGYNWTQHTIDVDGFGSHTLKWRYNKGSTGTSTDYVWVDNIIWEPAAIEPVESLQMALDVGWTVTTGGDADWSRTVMETYDDVDAAQSGSIGNSKVSQLQAVVEGAGDFSFWWKVDSRANDDYLEFYIDGVFQDRISGDQDWDEYSDTLTGSGSHTLMWQYIKDGYGEDGEDCGWVDYLEGPGTAPLQPSPLGKALDTKELEYTTGGDGMWYYDSSTYYYDNDAAQSYPYLNDSQESWLQTTVDSNSAETLSFWWKVSSESGCDYLEFYIDGSRQDRISGSQNWAQKSYNLSSGEHTLKWRYVKDGSDSSGDDMGWVDYIQWSGEAEDESDPTDWEKITYKYDPSGRRIEKSVDGTKTTYAYDGGSVLAEYDHDGEMLRKFVYGPGVDQPICMIEVADSNATYYYHFDGLGSVIALSNEDGNSVQTYEYSIYGQTGVTDANHTNPYMFTGRRFDVETGLYYYRARYYDSHIGRFLQTDPIGYRDGINWYAYCGNNPGNYTDPSGNIRIAFYDGSDPGENNTINGAEWREMADDEYFDISIDIGSLQDVIDYLENSLATEIASRNQGNEWVELFFFDHAGWQSESNKAGDKEGTIYYHSFGEAKNSDGTWNEDNWIAVDIKADNPAPGSSLEKFCKAIKNHTPWNTTIHLRGCEGANMASEEHKAPNALIQLAKWTGRPITGCIGLIQEKNCPKHYMGEEWEPSGGKNGPDYEPRLGRRKYRIAIPVPLIDEIWWFDYFMPVGELNRTY